MGHRGSKTGSGSVVLGSNSADVAGTSWLGFQPAEPAEPGARNLLTPAKSRNPEPGTLGNDTGSKLLTALQTHCDETLVQVHTVATCGRHIHFVQAGFASPARTTYCTTSIMAHTVSSGTYSLGDGVLCACMLHSIGTGRGSTVVIVIAAAPLHEPSRRLSRAVFAVH